MDVNALHKDELEFELACRGITECKTVATMRKFLREILRREASGESSITFKVPVVCTKDPNRELVLCENKLSSLLTLISEVSQSPDQRLVGRIESRLTHLLNRTKLIIPVDTRDTEIHLVLLKDIEEALCSVRRLEQEDSEEEFVMSEHDKDILQKSLGEEALKILKKLNMDDGPSKNIAKEEAMFEPRGDVAPGRINAQVVPRLAEAPGVSSGNDRRPSPQWHTQSRPLTSNRGQKLFKSSTIDQDLHRRKLVPIKDWGVRFSSRGTMSINAFLERIDELKNARNADDEDLFRQAIDFFEEDALIWFRANKNAASNWAELVELLIDTFQTPNYQDELLEEIKRRTQSKEESVVIYVSVMRNMFNRLPVPLSEIQKLVILRKNLQPYYQKEICRDTFNSVVELTSVLRVIERTKLSCESFREPSLSNQSLERDLAYQGTSSTMQLRCTDVAAIETDRPIQSKCWNCRSPGHRFRECNLPKQRLFCYKCGRFGNTALKCTCGNTAEGNDRAESMPANQTPRQ